MATSEFRVTSTSINDQTDVSLAALAGGGFVAVWTSFGQDGDRYGVFALRFDAEGVAQGSEIQVSTTTVADQLSATVVGDGAGGFMVSWSSNGQGLYDIFARRFDSSGVASGGEVRVNSYTASDQGNPAITTLAGGGFVVAWQSSEQDGSGDGVYAQRYDADGSPAGIEFRVNATTTDFQRFPSIAGLAGGGFVVTWMGNLQDGSGTGVFAQRFDAAGVALGGEFQVNTYTEYDQGWEDYLPGTAIAGLGDGGFVITWFSHTQDGSGKGIFAQRFAADGRANGTEFQVNTYTNFDQSEPAVAVLADDGFVISWRSRDQDGLGFGVYAQRFDAAGNRAGDEFQVNTVVENNQYGSAVAGTTDGGFVIAWQSLKQDGSGWGIFAKRYERPTGDISGTPGADQLDLTGTGGSTALGGTGNDTYLVDDLQDVTSELASQGVDTVRSPIGWTLAANIEQLILIGPAPIDGTGNSGNNTLTGNSAGNRLAGGAGNDIFSGGAGADTLVGGNGNDTYLVGAGDRITETSSGGSDTVKSAINWTLAANIEKLILTGSKTVNGNGSSAANALTGNQAANRLNGAGGADTLIGGGGNDVLKGGAGNDRLTGGAGADVFAFDTALSASTNSDALTDFTPGSDSIRLDRSVFTALTEGALAPGQFHSGDGVTSAAAADHRILYDTATGALYYDADGTGTVNSPIQFAVLIAHPSISAADLVVVA